MKLNITKPLAFIKVHTTGVDPSIDRIVAITITRFEPNGTQRKGTRFINPERDIPMDAVAIHGITNERVENEKTFDQVGKNLFDFINDADIAGFNVKFDIEMLMEEFGRINLDYVVYNRKVIDLYDIYLKKSPRNFVSAVAQYVDQGFEQNGPIGTEQYADLCVSLMDGMLGVEGKQVELQSALEDIGINTRTLDVRGFFALDESNRPVFNVGKHKGKVVAELLTSDPSYYQWMRSDKSKLPKDVIALAERILKKAKSATAEKA